MKTKIKNVLEKALQKEWLMSSVPKKNERLVRVFGIIMTACSLALLAVGFVLCIVSGQNNFFSIFLASLFCFAGAWLAFDTNAKAIFPGGILFIAGIGVTCILVSSVQTDVVMERSGKIKRLAPVNQPNNSGSLFKINPFCERALYYPDEMKVNLYEGRSYVLVAIDNSYGDRLYRAYGGDWKVIRDSIVHYVDNVYNGACIQLNDPGLSHPARWQIMRAQTLDELYRMQKEEGILPYVEITAWRLTDE